MLGIINQLINVLQHSAINVCTLKVSDIIKIKTLSRTTKIKKI